VNASARDWLRCYRPRPGAALRLLCFPHASGNATFYRDWTTRLPPEVELVAVQYPGRLDRIKEPCVLDMPTMVDAITDAVRPVLDGPFALFGHSMGAAIAYEVALGVARRYEVAPVAAFLSGRPAPRHHRPGVKHLGDDDALWGELRRLGGTADEALDHPDLRAALMPTLRGDYRLIETYQPSGPQPLASPIVALSGTDDPEAAVSEVADWVEYTERDFTLHVFEGNHFYLVPHRDAVVATVAQGLLQYA
jgi:pyochelin biosynthetic protein PchC